MTRKQPAANRHNRQRGKRQQSKRKRSQQGGSPRYGVAFTEKGRDALVEILAQYQDRPLYYVLNEHGDAVPLGRNYLLTVEERAQWQAFSDDASARTLAETIIPNPSYPDHPVVVHTSFMAMESSFAYPQPDGSLVLWCTNFLDRPLNEIAASAEETEDDGSWLLEPVPEPPAAELDLAAKLGMDIEAFDEWSRVYSTREEALQGHDETVRWVRHALGTF